MIAVIGSSGKLGKELMSRVETLACPIRFEHAKSYGDWFDNHPEVDTIWHVARTCRKEGTRRDFGTFMLETTAMGELLKTRAKNCRMVFASTKVVYGITDDDVSPVGVDVVAKQFEGSDVGTYNFPKWKQNNKTSFEGLVRHHSIYALTKLACEALIRKNCSNHKIIRIWDII
jgi:nucleoside-diphosphate-sugar epimerase